jgi:hypothetical protein
MTDPLAAWRPNPFFVLEVSPRASRTEIERAGQRLLGLLAVGSAGAERYDTPFGPATRDADVVRQALAALRDPNERLALEFLADVAVSTWAAPEHPARGWPQAMRAIGWTGPCPE